MWTRSRLPRVIFSFTLDATECQDHGSLPYHMFAEEAVVHNRERNLKSCVDLCNSRPAYVF